MIFCRLPITIVLFAGAISAQVLAQPAAKSVDAHRQQDIARHRAMSQAHENAAKCLEAGKAEEVCLAELVKACKGLGIGKHCGMKH